MRPAHLTLLLLILCCRPTFADLARGRVFLHPLHTGVLPSAVDADPYPLLAVGTLDPATRPEDLTQLLTNGQRTLSTPRAGRIAFQLISPTLDGGEYWEPVSLERSGNDLTLRVEHWTDDYPRRKNIPRRTTQFFSAYLPEPGDYSVRLDVQDMFCAAAKNSWLYETRGLRSATSRVTVTPADKPAAADDAKPATINDADLKPQKASAVFDAPPRQHVTPTLIDLDLPLAKPGLRVGGFDLVAYQAAPRPMRGKASPELAAPSPAGPVYALVMSPRLNSGEYLTAGPVEWAGNHCTITADLWTDDGERTKNLVHNDLLVLPLAPPARGAQGLTWPPGDYKVTLKWNPIRSQAPGASYTPTPNPAIAPDPATTEATFTLK